MEITNKDIKVLGRIVSIAVDNIVADAEQIYDYNFNKDLATINQETDEYIVEAKHELKGDIDALRIDVEDKLDEAINNLKSEGIKNPKAITISASGTPVAVYNGADYNIVDIKSPNNSIDIYESPIAGEERGMYINLRLSTNINRDIVNALKYAKGWNITKDSTNSLVYYLKDAENKTVSTINIPQDTFLDSASLDSNNILTLTFNTASGKQPVTVDMKTLKDVYTAGDGLSLSSSKFAIKVDSSSNNALTVGSAGIKLSSTPTFTTLTTTGNTTVKNDLTVEGNTTLGHVEAGGVVVDGRITAEGADFDEINAKDAAFDTLSVKSISRQKVAVGDLNDLIPDFSDSHSQADAYAIIDEFVKLEYDVVYNDAVVGSLKMFTDNMYHGITQVFTSNYILNNSGEFEAHTDTTVQSYSRMYSFTSPFVPRATWSEWTLVNAKLIEDLEEVVNNDFVSFEDLSLVDLSGTTSDIVKAWVNDHSNVTKIKEDGVTIGRVYYTYREDAGNLPIIVQTVLLGKDRIRELSDEASFDLHGNSNTYARWAERLYYVQKSDWGVFSAK